VSFAVLEIRKKHLVLREKNRKTKSKTVGLTDNFLVLRTFWSPECVRRRSRGVRGACPRFFLKLEGCRRILRASGWGYDFRIFPEKNSKLFFFYIKFPAENVLPEKKIRHKISVLKTVGTFGDFFTHSIDDHLLIYYLIMMM